MSTLRKILATGMGAALMTEGTLRNAFNDLNVPKQAKDYLSKVLATELKRFLDHINLKEEIRKAMEGLTVEVEAKVRFSSNLHPKSHGFSLKKFKIKKG